MSMKKIAAAAMIGAPAACAGGAQGRDPGTPDERTATLDPFDSILVGGTFKVTVRKGDLQEISLSGPSTMLDDTELRVRDGKLIIGWREGAGWSRNGDVGVDVDITLPALREVMSGGPSLVRVDDVEGESFSAINGGAGRIELGHVAARSVQVKMAGSGPITIDNIEAEDLLVHLAGAGSLNASGNVSEGTAVLAGAGSFNAAQMSFARLDLTLASSGSAAATVTDHVSIKAVSSGSATITGGAACSVNSMGSGKVDCS